MKFGTIVYSEIVENQQFKGHIEYVSLTDYTPNPSPEKPTLIIGFVNFNKLYGSMFGDISILNKEIIPNKLYWEFSINENKNQYLRGITNFEKYDFFKYATAGYKYVNIDPLFNNIKSYDHLYKLLPKNIDKVYVDNRMMYILSNFNVFGIDLLAFEYYKINIEPVVRYVTGNSKHNVIDLKNEYYDSLRLRIPNVLNLKRFIVIFI